ncbi:hypothetical protein FK530_22875 [Tsukamurella conjunctivitidis]|uniref:Uncharacterized protein n=1 Tax=Tsukamurella conjunctivitidis TaxID=2592068 RepID=A0A5C5RR79_9ACTN|nr:hypothetical protein [Tsukamurella conjunctivitidis]TWS25566.1 hypothetical protein FK530_22875 [Tsukamurella conjunctivitidis]
MTAFTIRRLHPDILAIDDGTRAWTATVDPDRSVRRIANATSGRALKLDGPLGKRITAAVHDWLVECAEQLPAALDEYVRTLTDSTEVIPRLDAWDRCKQLGANRYDYDRARRRAEGIAS